MTALIKILPKQLQHKIAAGEVVERPASALKELVENAIDASATRIEVDLLGGGIDRLTVRDDGIGMSHEDAELAFERYSTSKLASEEDLYKIGTMGFRGEALASIAAVSQVALETKQKDSLEGTRIEIKGGNAVQSGPCGCAAGTSITVAKLFFNTPARKKYLKTVNTENRHCLDVVTDQAIIHPKISFKLTSNTKQYFDLPRETDWLRRVGEILGGEWLDDMLTIDHPAEPFCIRGFVGKPRKARENRKHQYLFVNKRRVGDYLVGYRVKQAFHTLLDKKLHPIFILDIEVPPDFIDVNVHPRKAEIKFSQPNTIYKIIEEAVLTALARADLIPKASFAMDDDIVGTNRDLPLQTQPSSVKTDHPYQFTDRDRVRWELRDQKKNYAANIPPQTPPETKQSSTQPGQTEYMLAPNLIAVAQLYATYIVAQDDKGILLIDQHAAQERAMYERFLQQISIPQTSIPVEEQAAVPAKQASRGHTQLLLTPQTIELTWQEFDAVKTLFPFLRKLSLDIDAFGDKEIIVRAVPTALTHVDLARLLKELADEFLLEKKAQQLTEAIEKKLIMRACKISVKANEKLDQRHMQKIVDDLLACDQPHTCPHGRPTMIRLQKKELEKMFGRR